MQVEDLFLQLMQQPSGLERKFAGISGIIMTGFLHGTSPLSRTASGLVSFPITDGSRTKAAMDVQKPTSQN